MVSDSTMTSKQAGAADAPTAPIQPPLPMPLKKWVHIQFMMYHKTPRTRSVALHAKQRSACRTCTQAALDNFPTACLWVVYPAHTQLRQVFPLQHRGPPKVGLTVSNSLGTGAWRGWRGDCPIGWRGGCPIGSCFRCVHAAQVHGNGARASRFLPGQNA